MFGSAILDVGIGVVLVFLLLSFIATALRETLEGWRKSRAAYLEKGIIELLGGLNTPDMPRIFYEHPLIYSLYRGKYTTLDSTKGGKAFAERMIREAFLPRGRALPTYIPSKNFAGAIIDLAVRGAGPSEYASAQTAADISVASIRANAYQLQNARLVRALLTATDFAAGDVTKVKDNLGDWYDSAMDRVSGWYKRATQAWLFVIGLLLAAALNVNIFRVADTLWRDKALRETVTARADAIAHDTAYQRWLLRDTANRSTDVRQTTIALTALDLPIGWSDSARREVRQLAKASSQSTAGRRAYWGFWLSAILAYLVTALAVTLGAPFWFDVLNKFMVIRSTVKPHEKSPEESSEDRQKGDTAKPSAGGAAPTVALVTPPASPTPGTAAAPQTSPPRIIDPDFERREWDARLGLSPDEGDL